MRALVVAGGDVQPDLLLRELEAADAVFCADGGARHLAALARLPDVLVGDMDSIRADLLQELESAGVEIIRVSAQKDETDGGLATDEAIARGASELVLLGATGGRVDHTLGNLMLLLRAARRGVRAVIKDSECEITAATGEFMITGQIGQTVSLLPVGAGVSVRYLGGLRYGTLDPLPLPDDSPVGVSNEMTADRAHVVIDGWVYVIHNKIIE